MGLRWQEFWIAVSCDWKVRGAIAKQETVQRHVVPLREDRGVGRVEGQSGVAKGTLIFSDFWWTTRYHAGCDHSACQCRFTCPSNVAHRPLSPDALSGRLRPNLVSRFAGEADTPDGTSRPSTPHTPFHPFPIDHAMLFLSRVLLIEARSVVGARESPSINNSCDYGYSLKTASIDRCLLRRIYAISSRFSKRPVSSVMLFPVTATVTN